MRIYQVTHRSEASDHEGYSYYSDKKTAAKEQSKQNKTAINGAHYKKAEVRVIEVIPSRKGIINALNRYASHPDNG